MRENVYLKAVKDYAGWDLEKPYGQFNMAKADNIRIDNGGVIHFTVNGDMTQELDCSELTSSGYREIWESHCGHGQGCFWTARRNILAF